MQGTSHRTAPSTRRRSHRPGAARRALAWLVLVAFQLAPPGVPVALAAPQGEHVVHGDASFHRAGDLTVIDTRTQRTIINYTGFDIWAGETVLIHQPDVTSVTLNRVLSTDPTHVNGTLRSNGQVWILNPVGVFVGDTALIDVGGLVAAAAHVEDAEFLAGTHHFERVGGPVEVAAGARIHAADSVVLVGHSVANFGSIAVDDGMIALVAGDDVRLASLGGHLLVQVDGGAPDPDWAIRQAGTLDAGRGTVTLTAGDAYSLAMNHTGITRARDIQLEAESGLVEVSGLLDASNDEPGGEGGGIRVLGDQVALLDATLDASGDAGGGEILVGGDFQGGGDTRTAQRSFVSDEAVLLADARRSGDGGRIIVWADDATAFYGRLSARGGSESGDGGFAEISGKQSLVSRGEIDLGAPHGETGTLLYDPLRIVIKGGVAEGPMDGSDFGDADDFLRGSPQSDDPDGPPGQIDFDDPGAPGTPKDEFEIYESEIEGTDANIVLQAGRSVRVDATTAFVDDDVVVMAGNDLTIQVVAEGEREGTEFLGIDLGDDLTWRLSEGGVVRLSTEFPISEGGDDPPEIVVGTLVVEGALARASEEAPVPAASVSIQAEGVADITVGEIVTAGADRDGVEQEIEDGLQLQRHKGGSVVIATESGVVVVGRVDARGGNASSESMAGEGPLGPLDLRGDGGAGGSVSISGAGAVTVGEVDTSGGDGYVRVFDLEQRISEGIGGKAGAIQIDSKLETLGSGSAGDPEPASTKITGNLTARGGDGLGREVVEFPGTGLEGGIEEEIGARGGAGGLIQVKSAGIVTLGKETDGQALVLDASGGHGTAAGGNAALANITVGATAAIHIESGEGTVSYASFVAEGGDAGFVDGVVQQGPGGLGGFGGDVVFTTTGNASIELREPIAAGASISTDGGNGFDSDTSDNNLNGQGGGAGNATAQAEGTEQAVSVFLDISAVGGDGHGGFGGAGGTVTLQTADGVVSAAGVVASGGDASRSISGDEDLDSLAPGVFGGAGGRIQLLAGVGEEETSVGGGDVLLAGDLVSLGGVGDPAEEIGPDDDPNPNHGLGGAVLVTTGRDIATSGADPDPVRIHAASIDLDGENIGVGRPRDLLLAANGSAGREDAVDRVDARANGAVRLLLSEEPDERFDEVSITQSDASASVDVLREGVLTTIVSADGAADGSRHRIQSIATGVDDPHLTYRLAVSELSAPASLAVAGPIALGPNGGKLTNSSAPDRADEDPFLELLGAIEGDPLAGPHVTTAGNLELEGTSVGSVATPFEVEGSPLDPDGVAPNLELSVEGDVALAVAGDVAALDLQQRTAASSVEIDLDGTAGSEVSIAGETVDTPLGQFGLSTVTRVDTTGTSGMAFFFDLEDAASVGQETSSPDGVLQIAAGAVVLGGAGGFGAVGDIVLQGRAPDPDVPDPGAPAIDAGGHALVLLADSNRDGTGEILASGPEAVDVAKASALVLFAGEGVGSEASPLRIVGTGADAFVDLAGTAGSGGFHLENGVADDDAAGGLRVATVELAFANDGDSTEASFRGLHAGEDLHLENHGRPIVFGEVQPDSDFSALADAPSVGVEGTQLDFSGSGSQLQFAFGDTRVDLSDLRDVSNSTQAHVVTGGSQRYGGPVLLANPRTFVPFDDAGALGARFVHEVHLDSGGDVVFEGDVDTGQDAIARFVPDPDDPDQEQLPAEDRFVAATLRVDAQRRVSEDDDGVETLLAEGNVSYGGHVGENGALAHLETASALLTDGEHRFTVGAADFQGTLDGPGSALLVATGEGVDVARLTFRGDVGAANALQAFDADADDLVFTSANRVVTGSGGIRLNTATPEAQVPRVATISDSQGGLSLETTGDFAMGRREKLAATEGLAIRAGGTAAVGDLAAVELLVDAPQIQILGRESGDVLLPNGDLVTDSGVDLVGNDIAFSSIPIWDGVGAAPTLVLGDGGLSLPGGSPFPVIRFTAGVDAISPAHFAGSEEFLDLTGSGRPVVTEATGDIPRETPPVLPPLEARFSDTKPARVTPVDGEQVLGYIRCTGIGGSGAACGPDAASALAGVQSFGRTVLATERAREIVERYHELVASPDGRARLIAAFGPAERGYRALRAVGPVDGAALYGLLASDRAYAEAQSQVRELAAVLAQVELLELDDASTERVRKAIAEDFAAGTGVTGLDAASALAAVQVTGVGLPRAEAPKDR